MKVVTLRDAPTYVEQEIRTYSQSDLDGLFSACSADERLLFEFFLYTGAREQEAMHAEWADLQQGGQIPLIREKKQWCFKPKGRKERRVRVPDFLAEELLEAQTPDGRLGRARRARHSRERTQPPAWLAGSVGLHAQNWREGLLLIEGF